MKNETKQKNHPKFASYSTTCPVCNAKDQLEVIQYTVLDSSPLEEDGFIIGHKVWGTDNETVYCKSCKEQFSLADVIL